MSYLVDDEVAKTMVRKRGPIADPLRRKVRIVRTSTFEPATSPRQMIRIAITPAAFEAIAATLPLGSLRYEPQTKAKGERLIWLEAAVVDRLMARPKATATFNQIEE